MGNEKGRIAQTPIHKMQEGASTVRQARRKLRHQRFIGQAFNLKRILRFAALNSVKLITEIRVLLTQFGFKLLSIQRYRYYMRRSSHEYRPPDG